VQVGSACAGKTVNECNIGESTLQEPSRAVRVIEDLMVKEDGPGNAKVSRLLLAPAKCGASRSACVRNC
jgi:hypothetical protein